MSSAWPSGSCSSKADVEMVVAGPVEKITDAQKILAKAAEMEQGGVTSYNQAAINAPRTPMRSPSRFLNPW